MILLVILHSLYLSIFLFLSHFQTYVHSLSALSSFSFSLIFELMFMINVRCILKASMTWKISRQCFFSLFVCFSSFHITVVFFCLWNSSLSLSLFFPICLSLTETQNDKKESWKIEKICTLKKYAVIFYSLLSTVTILILCCNSHSFNPIAVEVSLSDQNIKRAIQCQATPIHCFISNIYFPIHFKT